MARPANTEFQTPLLPIIYLFSLVGIFAAACLWWFWPTGAEGNVLSTGSFANEDAYDRPTAASPFRDVRQTMIDSLSSDQAAERVIRDQLTSLERYVRDRVTGKSTVRPVWIGADFKGVGIDPAKFVLKSADDFFSVHRYIAADSAPKFSGNRSFQQFVTNASANMSGCKEFEIQLRLAEFKAKDSTFSVKILSIAKGVIEQTKDDFQRNGARKKVIQTTEIWNTTWNRSQSQPRQCNLIRASVLATEKVNFALNTSQMFIDCTDSILGDCNCADRQLAYGLDQWAAKIPGVDPMGNQGIAIGDVNGDGLDDIYLCQGHGMPNRLFVQKRDGTVVDRSEDSQVGLLDDSRSALLVDLDNDADQDLIVATRDHLVVFSNHGKGVFEIETKLPLADNGLSLTAADYDSDGDLDIFLCRHATKAGTKQFFGLTKDLTPATNVLLRNDEAFQFTDVTRASGLGGQTAKFSRSSAWLDIDADGDLDLYVANENGSDQCFRNQDGNFTDVSETFGLQTASSNRSVSVGDFNIDGLQDLMVAKNSNGELADPTSEGKPSSLNDSEIRFLTQEGKFDPYFLKSPIFDNQLANSSAVADINNDGKPDLIVGNGGLTRLPLDDSLRLANAVGSNHLTDPLKKANRHGLSMASRQRNCCFLNIGSAGFAELSTISGLDLPDDTRAIATTDWDHDGDLDVITTSRSGPQLRIFINVFNRKNAVSFRLFGSQSNRDAIGASVELYLDQLAQPLVKTVQAGSGFLSQSSKQLVFGVDNGRKIQHAIVRWPTGEVQRIQNLSIGSLLEVHEGNEAVVEKTNDRFRLNIRGSVMVGTKGEPAKEKRVALFPQRTMPAIEMQVAHRKWSCSAGSKTKPTLVLFWTRNSESEQALEKLNRIAAEMTAADVELLTVLVDQDHLDPDEQWEYTLQTAANHKEINHWSTLAPAGLQQLKLVWGDWFGQYELAKMPMAMLLKPDQTVFAVYNFEAINKAQLVSDCDLVSKAGVDTVAAGPVFPGTWINDFNWADGSDLVDQLKKLGHDETANSLQESDAHYAAFQAVKEAQRLAFDGKFDSAKARFETAIETRPSFVPALIGLGNLLFEHQLSQLNLAQDLADDEQSAAFTAKPSPQLEQAISSFENALTQQPDCWQAAIGIAKVRLIVDRPAEALDRLEQYLAVDPDRNEIYAMIGRILFQAGRHQEAIRYLSRAYDHQPNLPYLAGDLGYLYLITQEPKSARKYLRLAHKLQPSDTTFLRLLAEAEFVTGNFDRAVSLFKRVNQLEPGQIRSKNILAWLFATCPYASQRDGAAAISLIGPSIDQFEVKSPSSLEIYAACFAEIGEFDKAVEFQQRAFDLLDGESVVDHYSPDQQKGMLQRLEMYRDRQPYRTADTALIPISPTGPNSGVGFSAIRM
jgi:tetratricopeptide (TPR) repeat protein